MTKIIVYIFSIFLLLLNVKQCLSSFTVQDVTIDKSKNNIYGDQGGCRILELMVLLSDPDIESFFYFKIYQPNGIEAGINRALYTPTSALFSVSINSYPEGLGPLTLICTNGIINETIVLDISCNKITVGDIIIENLTEMYPTVMGVISSTYKLGGLQYLYANIPGGSGSSSMVIGKSVIAIALMESLDYNILNQVSSNLYFDSQGTKYVYQYSYYKNSTVDSVSDFKLYTTNQNIELISQQYAPVFTFSSNSTNYSPSFRLSVNYANDNGFKQDFTFRIISTDGTTSKYIGFFDYTDNVGIVSNYSLHAQEFDKITIRESFNLNITQLSTSTMIQNTGTIQQNFILATVESIMDTTKYFYSPIYYSYHDKVVSKKDFPFGFKYGSNNVGYTYSATVLFPDIDISPTSLYVYPDLFDKFSGFNGLINSPVENYVYDLPVFGPSEFIHLYDHTFIIRFNITYSLEIYKLSISDKFYFNPGTTLTNGDKYGGTFEIIVNQLNPLTVLRVNDLTNGVGISNSFYSLNYPPLVEPYLYQDNFNNYDIKNATILYKTLNVTNEKQGNILYFNYSNIDINTPMSFIANGEKTYGNPAGIVYQSISSSRLNEFFPVKWNSTISMFQVEFWIPKNSQPGYIPFAICFKLTDCITNKVMGPNAQFKVISNNADLFGPIFSKIEKYPSSSVIVSGDINEFGWILTIEDFNGFSHGKVRVRGVNDGSVYNFPLIATSNIQSDQYKIELNAISNCVSQDYIISDVELYDTENNNSTFTIQYLQLQYPVSLYNPFINYINDSNINRISIVCGGIIDDTPPIITDLIVSTPIVDVGASELLRTVIFNLTVIDEESGLKDNHLPTIYITAVNFQTIECSNSIITQLTPFSNRYDCTIVLPLGFGFPYGSIISVYGLVNNGGYYGGYSNDDLNVLGLPITRINSTLSLDYPVILGSGRISTLGGQLWINGRGLMDVNTATAVIDSTAYPLTINKTIGNSAVLLNDIPEVSIEFTITVSTISGKLSNIYSITPFENVKIIEQADSSSSIGSSSTSTSSTASSSTSSSDSSNNPTTTPTTTPSQIPTVSPIPTNAPQKCLGTPECGGPTKGICTQNGCACYSPYVGNDCSSEIIIVNPPIKNTTDPSTEIKIPPTNAEILYKSFVSLVSIRELDFNDNVLFEYPFEKWIYTELSNSTFTYTTNITKTIKTSDGIQTEIITPVTALLQWFNIKTNITFANQELTMNPSTIKYTIYIGKFKFENALTKLELVMSASFTSSSNDDCSLNEFGETSSEDSANYLKLSIDNHSMYARFLKRGVVDNFVVSITNRVLDSTLKHQKDTQSSTSSFIGIIIPFYESSVIMDPDFSVLLDHDDASSNSNSICGSLSSNSLSSGAIAGIVVGSVAFASVISVSVVYHLVQNKKKSKFLKAMNNKLDSIRQ